MYNVEDNSSSDEFSATEEVDLTNHHSSPTQKVSQQTIPSAPSTAGPGFSPPDATEDQMQAINGDIQALQGQRDEIAQMQAELEALRAHTTAVSVQTTGDNGQLDPEAVKRATQAVEQISEALGSYEEKIESISASPVRQRRVQEVEPDAVSPTDDATATLEAMVPTNDDDDQGGADPGQLAQLRQLQQMQSALELLETQLSGVDPEGGEGSVTDLAQLQEQMAMVQNVMGQLGAMGATNELGQDVGTEASASASASTSASTDASTGTDEAGTSTRAEIGGSHNGAPLPDQDPPSFDDIVALFQTHGLEMDREELKVMLTTEQGTELVQQVMELTRLRDVQEAQMVELQQQQQEGGAPGADLSNARHALNAPTAPATEDAQLRQDLDNVKQLFMQRGYALSDEDVLKTLASERGKALALKLRRFNPEEREAFGASQAPQEVPEQQQQQDTGAPQAAPQAAPSDRDALRALLLEREIALSEDELTQLMETDQGQEMVEQLRELRETQAQLYLAQQPISGSNPHVAPSVAPSVAPPANPAVDPQERALMRQFLQEQRGDQTLTDEEVDAVLVRRLRRGTGH